MPVTEGGHRYGVRVRVTGFGGLLRPVSVGGVRAEPDEHDDLRLPVPGELRRETVRDADAQCPRCGAQTWILVEQRAEPEEDWTRWRALGCAGCGWTAGWQSAGRRRPGRGDPEDAFGDAPFADTPSLADVLERVTFPLVGPDDDVRVSSYGWDDEGITNVCLSGEDLWVETSVQRGPLVVSRASLTDQARSELAARLRELDHFAWSGRSRAAEEAHFHAWYHAIAVAAEAAAVREATWPVGGTSTAFVVLATDGAWAAATDLTPRVVTVSGSGAVPVDLALVVHAA